MLIEYANSASTGFPLISKRLIEQDSRIFESWKQKNAVNPC